VIQTEVEETEEIEGDSQTTSSSPNTRKSDAEKSKDKVNEDLDDTKANEEEDNLSPEEKINLFPS